MSKTTEEVKKLLRQMKDMQKDIKEIKEVVIPEIDSHDIAMIKRHVNYSLEKAEYISREAKDGVAIFYCPDPDFAHLTSEIETALHNLKSEMDVYRDKIKTDRKRLGIVQEEISGKTIFSFGPEKYRKMLMKYGKKLLNKGVIKGFYFVDVDPNILEMETIYNLGKSGIKKQQIRLGSY